VVEAIDRTGIGKNSHIDEEIIPSSLTLEGHHEEICLDPVDMKIHDIMLGYP